MVTYSDVTNRTGESYTSATEPSSTQVTNFITAAKNIVKGENGGTAVDESDQEEVEIVLDVVEILVHNYKVGKMLLSDLQRPGVPEKRWPTMNDNIRAKVALAWPGTRSGMEYSAGTTRYWK